MILRIVIDKRNSVCTIYEALGTMRLSRSVLVHASDVSLFSGIVEKRVVRVAGRVSMKANLRVDNVYGVAGERVMRLT